MKELIYTIVMEPAEEGGFNVSVPALPGCFTQGDSFDHALTMAQDAIALWLDALAADGQAIPEEQFTAEVQVAQVRVAAPSGA